MLSGRDIKHLRIDLGIKAIDLSKRLGISNVQLSLIENGHVECPERIEKLLVEILNIH